MAEFVKLILLILFAQQDANNKNTIHRQNEERELRLCCRTVLTNCKPYATVL
jgi:hypothetical protein